MATRMVFEKGLEPSLHFDEIQACPVEHCMELWLFGDMRADHSPYIVSPLSNITQLTDDYPQDEKKKVWGHVHEDPSWRGTDAVMVTSLTLTLSL
jgi:hypothetical protein